VPFSFARLRLLAFARMRFRFVLRSVCLVFHRLHLGGHLSRTLYRKDRAKNHSTGHVLTNIVAERALA
jgi:hypothetical protein